MSKELEDKFNEDKSKYTQRYKASDNQTYYLDKLIERLAKEVKAETKKRVSLDEKSAFIKKLKLMFKEEPKELTREEGRQAAKEIDTQATETQALNELLKRIFGGTVRLNGQPVSSKNFNRAIDKDMVTVKGKGRKTTAVEIGELIGIASGSELTPDQYELSQKPHIKTKIELIAEYADVHRAATLDIKDLEIIQVRGRIKELLGWGRYWETTKRNNIYSSWKDIEGKHEVLVSALRALYSVLKEGEEKNTLDIKIKEFVKNGQYVLQFKNQSIKENQDNETEATIKLIDGFIDNVLGLGETIPVGEQGTMGDNILEEDDGWTEQGSYSDSKTTRTASQTKRELGSIRGGDELDILGYFYVQNYMDGIFINETSLDNIKNITRETMGEYFAFSSQDQIRALEVHLERLEKVKRTTRKAYLPIHILEDKKILRFAPDEFTSVAKINGVIADLFDALLEVLLEQRMIIGQIVDAPRGQTMSADSPDSTQQSTYGGAYHSKPAKRKDSSKIIQGAFDINFGKEKITDVLDAMVDYFYRPLMDPVMNLSLNYGYKNNKSFKELLLLTDSDFALAYKKIYRKVVDTNGEVFSKADLNKLLVFFKVTNKPQIKVKEVYDSMLKLRPVIRELFDDGTGKGKKLIETFKVEMASYLGHLIEAKNLETSVSEFLGVNIKEAFENNPIDNISEMTIIMVIQDFLLDKNAKSIMTRQKQTYDKVINEINELRKSDIEDKILQVHDSLRILKKLPVYYGRGSLSSMDDLGEVIDAAKKTFDVDIIGTEIVKMVEEIDAFSNISKSVGVSEEVVYFVKANFR